MKKNKAAKMNPHPDRETVTTFRTLMKVQGYELSRLTADSHPKVHYAVLGGGPCEVCGSTKRNEVCREGPDHHP